MSETIDHSTSTPRERRKSGRRPGRPEGTGYHPTPEQRQLVESLTGFGIPQDAIVTLVINPQTGKPISEVTLREHFKREIAQGKAKADSKVVAALFTNATTPTALYPGGHPSSQIFWVKARMGWRTTDGDGEAPPPSGGVPGLPGAGGSAMDEQSRREIARRIAFALHLAGRANKLPAARAKQAA